MEQKWRRLEVLRAAANSTAQATAKLREITGEKSMQGMIRLLWMEDQSKSDQIGKKKFSVGELQMYAGLVHSK